MVHQKGAARCVSERREMMVNIQKMSIYAGFVPGREVARALP
jgi:hypothetical protein